MEVTRTEHPPKEGNMKIGLETLTSAKAAESTLKREARQRRVAALPAEHPLAEELEKARAELGDDLEGLPESHPLMVELKAAEKRYELAAERETEDAEKEDRKVRKAQKMDRRDTKRRQRIEEEDQGRELREAATQVNKEMDASMTAVRGLYQALETNDGVLSKNRLNAARSARLKRMLAAFERGISETRMSRA
jgi:hypothetical protein